MTEDTKPDNTFTVKLGTKALDQLFKNLSDEVFVQVQTSALDQYARRRVKAMLPAETDRIIKAAVEEAVAKQIGEVTFSNYSYPPTVAFAKTMESTLHKMVESVVLTRRLEIENSINQKIDEAIQYQVLSKSTLKQKPKPL